MSVRLLKNGKATATSAHQMTSDDETQPLTDLLTRARNSLFDEELHHELQRESRSLINQGVRSVGNAIRFPLKDDSEIEVDLQPVGEADNPLEGDSAIPTAIAMTLRILLSHAHRSNHRQRSQPPPPISDNPTPRRLYPLLRPLIEFNQHDTAIKAAHHLLENLSCTLSVAKLPFSSPEDNKERCPKSALTTLLAKPPHPLSLSSLPSRLLQPHRTTISIHLPSTRATIDIHTSPSPPTFGTAFQLRTVAGPALPQTLHFPTVDKLAKHLYSLTALGIVAFLLREEEEALAGKKGWRQTSPYIPEMRRRNGARKDRVAVSVDGEGLGLECVVDGKGERRRWRVGVRGDEEGGKGVVEVFNELGM